MKKIIRKLRQFSIRNFKTGIINFWLFRKEIYNFRDFDYGFNFDLFRKSLELTRDAFIKNDITGSAKTNAEEIQYFLDLTKNNFEDIEEYEKQNPNKEIPKYDWFLERKKKAFLSLAQHIEGWWS